MAGVGGEGGLGGFAGGGGTGGSEAGSVVELDPTFGIDGLAVFSVLDGGLTWDGASAVAVLPDGRVIVVGRAGDSVFGPMHGYLAVLTEDGVLDGTFGGSGAGLLLEDFAQNTEFDSVVVDGAGRILVGGWTRGSSAFDPGELTVARYQIDGSRDDTFGNDGTFEGLTRISQPCAPRASDIALESDGRIVATGTGCEQPDRLSAVRLLSDGTPDPDFGDNGVLVLDPGYSDEVLVSAAGAGTPRIVVGGSVGEPGFNGTLDFALAGLLDDGSYDAAFGVNGMVVTDFGDGSPGRTEGLTALAFAEQGRILAGGWIQLESNFSEPWRYSYDLLVAAYDETGAVDGSFGEGGAVLIDFGSDSEEVVEVLLRQNGNILVVGGSSPFGWDKTVAIAHLNSDGSPAAGEHRTRTELESGGLDARAAAIDAQGRLLVASKIQYADGKSDVAVTRYVVRPLN
jgi:uncharacterized delta-60 repeat protein